MREGAEGRFGRIVIGYASECLPRSSADFLIDNWKSGFPRKFRSPTDSLSRFTSNKDRLQVASKTKQGQFALFGPEIANLMAVSNPRQFVLAISELTLEAG